MDQPENVIVLKQEDGRMAEYEAVDILNLDGQGYIFLIPKSKKEDGFRELIIRKADGCDYTPVDDGDELEKAYAFFKQKYKHLFDFSEKNN